MEFSDNEDEDEDDGGVVPQKIHEDLQRKYRYIKKQRQDLQEELEDCKIKCAELEKEKEDLVAELATYRSLNITLQQNINEVLQRAFSKTGPSLLNRHSATFESTPDQRSDELPNSPEGNNSPLHINSPESPLRLYEIKDGKIHVGENIWIREEVWRKITAATKDSLFVKEMAVALWGTATLQRRSVSGKECPTNRNSPKPPLTPSKLQVLRVCFSDWLKKKEPERREREKREKQRLTFSGCDTGYARNILNCCLSFYTLRPDQTTS
ncbi:hypothetical protein QQF64_014076 [Cirrhinus molitorella]|uniref:BEN domain-containing protein n=1 Tax=Cirrhinus molitorella TaxID=172907 RepID=A0ABR3LUL6_9TELE